MKSKRNKRSCDSSSFLHHPISHTMAPRQNPSDKVLATFTSTPASLHSPWRVPAGNKDKEIMWDFENCYQQLQAVKDDIVEAGDTKSSKDFFAKLEICSVSVLFFMQVVDLIDLSVQNFELNVAVFFEGLGIVSL